MNMNYRLMSNEEKDAVKQYIIDNCEIKSSVQIASELDLSYNTIAALKTELGLTKMLNPIVFLNVYQHDIILGGILGDGNIKPNGKTSCYYRECHAISETDYLLWKFQMLYNLTTKRTYDIPIRSYCNQPQIAFQTINSPTFTWYKALTLEQVVSMIGPLGLYIFFLDDGWVSKAYYKGKLSSCSFNISGGVLTLTQMQMVCKRFFDVLGIELHIVGKQSFDFLMPCKYNEIFVTGMLQYFDINMDIMQKKILPYLNKKNGII